MSMSGRGPISWPWALVLLAAVFAADVAAVVLAPDGPTATWWPGSGISIALLVLASRRSWWWLVPAIAAVTVAANLAGDRPVDLAFWYAVANAVEALVVAWFLRRHDDRRPTLATLDDFVGLVMGALLGGLVMAALAATGIALLDDGSMLASFRSVFVSHSASTLVILPLAMAPARRLPRSTAWEVGVQATALAAVTLLVFWPGQTLTTEFLPLPLLVWAAIRFGTFVVAVELFVFAVTVTFMSAAGNGPFGFDYERGAVDAFGMGAVVQAYILAAALMSLPLAIGVEQRRRLLDRTTASERLFRHNFTESVVGMLLMRSSGPHLLEITDMNDAAARLLGPPAETVGRGLGDLLDTSEPLDLVATRILTGTLEGWRAQVGVRGRPETRVNVAVSLIATRPEPMFAAQLLDVTTEHEARRRLEAAERLTSATLDTTNALIIVCDLYGEVVRTNRATTAISGFPEEAILGSEVWELPFMPPGSSGYPTGLPEDVHAQISRETGLITSSGERRQVLWNASYVCDDRDRALNIVLTGIDLTGERTAAGLNRHLLEAAMTTALIGIDPRGRITVFNTGAVNLLGYDAQDTVGTSFIDLLDPDQVAARCPGETPEECFARLVAGVETDRETPARDWTWLGSDGRRHTISMTLSMAADTVAARLGYLCVGRDVTEARASQELLVAALEKERVAVDRLRQLDTAKSEFVSTVSHELRTPVSSIVGYTEMLQDGSVDEPTPTQRRLLGSIERSGRRLIALCEDLLTLAGLDAGATNWDRAHVDLAELVTSAEEAIRPLLSGRELTVTFDAPGPVVVLGDRRQLDRVLINLLSNAVKFTEDGGRVECRVQRSGDDALLVVTDNGVGIPEEEQSGLFQRFFRSSTAQQRAIPGTGLGLSIVAATVAAHGGRIEVRSAHLEGTTFAVRLPLARLAGVRTG
ncbi:PAS domain S-box protein [Nocardioides sp. MAH-18]|uniref:histidine kinase n=1 Tax=Nocardioides agri TaxID=2682843 RepID=A0A6L6XK92_9ACTN|nr:MULTISPECIES: ATP-binding protein [unclassified Nocardioides]MBA2956472.1 PAS domain S-box protein [Nocardioides sp. CGMCC 1.13656]MVQ47619.1 PAS domain S-box protein [Nocardioides sp. MAH-18]